MRIVSFKNQNDPSADRPIPGLPTKLFPFPASIFWNTSMDAMTMLVTSLFSSVNALQVTPSTRWFSLKKHFKNLAVWVSLLFISAMILCVDGLCSGYVSEI
jgi:magnesium-transporting ATPase (P-type)